MLLPDSFGSRGLGSQCGTESRAVRPGRERVADAFAAKAYLQARPDVKPRAVSLLGWSNGGSTVLYTAAAGRARRRRPGLRPRGGVLPRLPTPGRAGMAGPACPLMILVGSADDWTGAPACQGMAEASRARGEPVEITVYPGAYHDFDHPNLPVRERRSLAYTANGDGVAHVGTDPAARADALRRVPAFLAR